MGKKRTRETSVRDLLDASEAESLAEEMGEWRDNIEGHFSQTSKFEEVSAAADEAESVSYELERAIDSLLELEEKYPFLIEILNQVLTVPNPRSTSRAQRAGASAGDNLVAVEYIRTALEQISTEEGKETIEVALCEIDSQAEALGMIDFPGMY